MPSVMQMTSGTRGVERFENGVRGIRRRHENQRRIRAGLANRIRDRVEHRHVKVLGASLAGRHARDHFGAVLDHLLRVEAAFAPGEALHDDARLFVDENAHDSEVEEAKDAEDVKEHTSSHQNFLHSFHRL